MIENEKIISCSWTADGGSLEYDISDVDPDLGVLVQDYRVSSTTYEGKRIFQSDFFLFEPNSIVPANFQYLSRNSKDKLWDIIFDVKRKFFEEVKPEIVEHFIDSEHSIDSRYKLYTARFSLPDYSIEKTKHTIVYLKRTTPAKEGGGRSF